MSRIPADSFTVACAQACPTDAIVFGDINNPDSTVSQDLRDERARLPPARVPQHQPRACWYLARIRNPNPKMPGAEKMRQSDQDRLHHHRGEHTPRAEASHGGHSVMSEAIRHPRHAAKELQRVPLVTNHRSFTWITDKVSDDRAKSARRSGGGSLFIPCSPIALIGLLCIGYQISTGVGVWGENHPDGWAWDITNFVFWIGIGHAGTLISAILFLTRQKWRTSINRAAEAMTLFAVICAGIFPGIHVGRVWMAWFLAPIPNANGIWPNFRSPLLWDVFAVSTYFTVSVLFWYIGLVPDLATLRDRAKSRVRKFLYGIFALGWRGSNRQWRHYEMAYLLLAGLSTPLVLSVHSVVSFDFATSIVPGWHTTIFPPYFVAGAIFGGFAMVLTILIPARLLYPQLEDLITRAARRQHGEDHPADRLDRRLRLPDGAVHRLVQREPVRDVRRFLERVGLYGLVLRGPTTA